MKWITFLLLAAATAVAGDVPGPASGGPTPDGPAAPAAEAARPAAEAGSAKRRVVVIPVREQVDSPLLFIIRRGLKEAIEAKADAVVLDMKTPGGALDVTFEIMEALGKFPGETITFVDDQAISAGAFISATTNEIWFSPRGKIGAAAPVAATGQEIDKSMRQKVVSYLRAEVRSISEGKGYRGQVISAMIDEDFELKVGDTVLKPKGELLTLTASEAMKTYGEPPQPLLGAGIAGSVDELLVRKYGAGNFSVTRLEITWSEHVAVFLRGLAPILLGLGLLAIYVEFKTPGFGVFGITGIVCLGVVFLSNYVAGMSGHEPMLIFGLGLLLVLVELFFFPGVVVAALGGLVLMFGALIWSMADIWPNEPVRFDGDLLLKPLSDLGLGMLVAVGLALALAKFIPKGWFFNRLAVAQPIAGSAQVAGGAPGSEVGLGALIGRQGIAVTGLYPSGQIEIDGQRHEARLEVGSVPPGTRIVVRRRTSFGLLVEPQDSAL